MKVMMINIETVKKHYKFLSLYVVYCHFVNQLQFKSSMLNVCIHVVIETPFSEMPIVKTGIVSQSIMGK